MPAKIKAGIRGLEVVLANINTTKKVFDKGRKVAIENAGKILDREIKKNISLTEHSLAELRELDHPYAKRHGVRGKNLHSPYFAVHSQSGILKSSQKSEDFHFSNKSEHKAWMDERICPWVIFVLMGTARMIKRDFLKGSLDLKRKEIKKEIIQTMGRFRTRAGIMFVK